MIFWLKKLENNQNNGQMKKKYFLAEVWNLNFSCIERFNGSTESKHFRTIWTESANQTRIGQNDPWLANLDPNMPSWSTIGQFGQEWRKRPVLSKFGPELTKTTRDWATRSRTDQNGRDCLICGLNGPFGLVRAQIG